MAKSYSQSGQDLWVLSICKSPGFFVDVGFGDGIKISNTYLLELNGWSGIGVDPFPTGTEDRKATRVIKCAVSSWSGTSLFIPAGFYGGLNEYLDKHPAKKTDKSVTVKTDTLTGILDSQGAPLNIDYLSIDTEGSEHEVLLGLDFSKYSFRCITVEHNRVEPKRTRIRKLLTDKGYVFQKESTHRKDDYYVIRKTS